VPDIPVEKQLEDAGWEQGSLLPPLATSVIFLPSNPVTTASRAAVRSGVPTTFEGTGFTPHNIASGAPRPSDRLVVITQTCDIVRSPNVEPTVMAMRAFITENRNILGAAASNSTRNFLLDPDRGLVVDATIVSMIEKPFLATLTPEIGAPDPGTQHRFGLWLGHRFNRPALPDTVVQAVVIPILDRLRAMQADGDDDWHIFDEVLEVRVARIVGDLPFDVRLLFIIPEAGLSDGGVGLARLTGQMRKWFDPKVARLINAQPITYRTISVANYQETDRIYLDFYTYQGRAIQGLGPIPPI
jgi:hypothetical protein